MCVFFFKQKTAYEMSASLVGSEMCIRDSLTTRVSNPRTDHLPHKEKCTAQLKKEPLLAMDGGENQETSQFHLSQRVE